MMENLINMKQHCTFFLLVLLLIIFDQLVINIVFQVFYSSLGPDLVFQIWWLWHLLMFSIFSILFPLVIYYIGQTQYPEFSGLEARRFPGQEKPRVGKILPRRYIEHQISGRAPSSVPHHQEAQSCSLASHSRTKKVVESFTIVDIH